MTMFNRMGSPGVRTGSLRMADLQPRKKQRAMRGSISKIPKTDVPRVIQFDTPVGRIAVAATGRGLVRIDLPKDSSVGVPLAACPPVRTPKNTGGQAASGTRASAASARMAERARREILEYLSGRRRTFTVPVDLSGLPPFHAKALRAAGRIPFGRTRTYADLAASLGRPRGARAVGQAMARNPVPLVVPCHRVVGRSGLGGYGGGLDLKRRLLAIENSTRTGH
jgi:methylated-DNA-[protein]-cysteine S-methyltransferase